MEKMKHPLPDKPCIAVLPFVNMSDDPKQEYFNDGMTEEIITKLSMNSGLAVIARNSTFFYKGKRIKIQQIAQELKNARMGLTHNLGGTPWMNVAAISIIGKD